MADAALVAAARVCLWPSLSVYCPFYDLRAGGPDCVARESLNEFYDDRLADHGKSDEPCDGIRDSRNCLFLGRQIELLAVAT